MSTISSSLGIFGNRPRFSGTQRSFREPFKYQSELFRDRTFLGHLFLFYPVVISIPSSFYIPQLSMESDTYFSWVDWGKVSCPTRVSNSTHSAMDFHANGVNASRLHAKHVNSPVNIDS